MKGSRAGAHLRMAEPELGTQTRTQRGSGGYDVRSGGYRPRRSSGGGRRVIVLVALLALLAVGAYLALPPVFGAVARSLAEENPDMLRLPFVADAVREHVADRLDQPAGTDSTPVEFVIERGSSSRQITDDLVTRELVADRLAFSFILITEGVGGRLQAGAHTLNRTMTPREVADELQRPPEVVRRVTVALREGRRIEQVTAYLFNEGWSAFPPEDFYELAADPPDDIRADYPMLASLPDGASLEGYLGLGIFEVEAEIDAEGLLRTFLDRRQQELAPLLERSPPAGLEDFYEVMILASIVEAEATLDAERPVIAGVYLNRLDRELWPTRLLNADPTVVYGNDSVALRQLPIEEWVGYSFWTPPGGGMANVELDADLAGFQSYRQRGIPPWPISSPGLASIESVLEPDTSEGYLFFVAKNDGSNEHAFARTFEEHQENVDRYVRGGG